MQEMRYRSPFRSSREQGRGFARCAIHALVIALSFVQNAGAAHPPLEKPRVSIAVGGQSAMIYLPLTVAERLGYFKEEGLEVEISDFNGGSKALQAVVGGSADVVAGVYEHTVRMQSSGQHLESFVVMASSMQLALAVASSEADRIKTPLDLKGKKIGVSAPGSTTHMMVNRILASAGLKPEDVSIVGVGLAGSAVSAISSGEIDAICTAEATASLMEEKGLIKVLVDARTRSGTEAVFGGPIPTSVLYAKASFVHDYPQTTQALANAIIKAGKWLHEATPEAVAQLVPPSYIAGDRAVYLSALAKVKDGYSTNGILNAEGARDMVAALAAFDPKISPAQINLDDTYTNQFAADFAKRAH